MIVADRNLIFLHQEAASREEIIGRLASALQEQGYIGPDYLDAVLAREEEFPTGLPSEGVYVAIPHAFCGDVRKTGVAAAVLDTPVDFVNMGDEDEILPCSMVFLMCNAEGADSHIDDLQEMMGMFSEPELLVKLFEARDVEEFAYYFEHPELFAEEDE